MCVVSASLYIFGMEPQKKVAVFPQHRCVHPEKKEWSGDRKWECVQNSPSFLYKKDFKPIGESSENK